MLIGISELIYKTWHTYTSNFKHLTPYMFLVCIPSLLFTFFGIGLDTIIQYYSTSGTVLGVVSIIVSIVTALLNVWIYSAATKFIGGFYKTNTFMPWQESLRSTRGLLLALIINAIIVALAFTFGFLLLIIPGLIIGGWFMFTNYEVLFNKQGSGSLDVGALSRSRALVQGRWFAVVFTFIVPLIVFGLAFWLASTIFFFIISIALSFTLSFISLDFASIFIRLLSAVVGAIFAPIPIISGVILYFSAKENPVPTAPATPTPTP